MTRPPDPAEARASAACPHCGAAPCLALWRKLTLFAGTRARCRACGAPVQADTTQAWLALLPAIVFVLVELVLRPHSYVPVVVFGPLCILWFFVQSVFRVGLRAARPGGAGRTPPT